MKIIIPQNYNISYNYNNDCHKKSLSISSEDIKPGIIFIHFLC